MAEWIITSGVLILMVLLIRKIFKGKISLRLQYGLWLLVLVRLLVPVNFIDTDVSILNLLTWAQEFADSRNEQEQGQISNMAVFQQPQSGQNSYMTDASYSEQPETERTEIQRSEDGQIESSVFGAIGEALEKMSLAQRIWLAVWAAGMLVTGAVIIGVNISFAHRLKRARKPMDIREERAESLSGHSGLAVYMVSGLSSPCLFGVVHPAIYLPEGITEEQLPYVLAHEESHYRVGDHIWSLLRSLCLMLYWYHPLVWLAARISRQDSELACDERTIGRLGEQCRNVYGKILLDMTVERVWAADFLSCATTMTADDKSLKERIQLIAHKPRMLAVTGGAFAVIIAAVFCVACTGVREEPADTDMVSEAFEDPADSSDREPADTQEQGVTTAEQTEESSAAEESDNWDPSQDHDLSENVYYRVIRESIIDDPYFTMEVPEKFVGKVAYGAVLGETETGERYLQNLTLFHVASIRGLHDEQLRLTWRSVLYEGALCSYMWTGLPDMKGDLEEIVLRSGTWDIREMDYILRAAYDWHAGVGSRLIQANEAGTGAYFYSEPTDVQFDPENPDDYMEFYSLLTQCRDSFAAKSFPYEELDGYGGEIPRWRQDFETAMQIYSWFTCFGEVPTHGLYGSVYQPYEDSNGVLYAVADIAGVSNMEELRSYMNRYFEPELTDGLLSGQYQPAHANGKNAFVEADGVLYALCGWITETDYRTIKCQYMADFREYAADGRRMVQISAECQGWLNLSEEPLHDILTYTMEEQADGHWQIVGDFDLPINLLLEQ